jgi:FkbM family methyltransferase
MTFGGVLRRTLGRVRSGLGGARRLTEDHVIWAYRLLLDRDPESDAVIRQKLSAWRTTRELRIDILSSQEFRIQNESLAYSLEPQIVIKEIEGDVRVFIDLSDAAIGLSVLKGEYERSEMAFVRRTVKAGQTVVDIGSHIGFYAMSMASLVGQAGRVYAFEPHAAVANLLERSVAENTFQDRVIVERAAVGERSGTMGLVFIRKTLNSGGSYRWREGTEVPAAHEVADVRLVALDEYPIRRPIHFVKIDVEGSEPFVFRGAAAILSEDRPLILSEVHPVQLTRVSSCTPRELIREMKALGYGCRALKDGTPGASLTDVEGVTSVVFLPHS